MKVARLGRRATLIALIPITGLWTKSPARAANFPRVDPASFTRRFGTPDIDYSSEREVPRPPFVIRTIEYKTERVRFYLLADGPVGSPPPYKAWLYMGAQDTVTHAKLSAPEIEKRMAARAAKAK